MPALLRDPLSQIHVVRGDDDDDETGNTNVINILVIVLAILVVLGLILLGVLLVLRRVRNQRTQREHSPPQYNDVVGSDGSNNPNKNLHRLTIETRGNGGRSSVIMYGRNGQPMLANPNSPPHSPDNVPEIHITFPEEEDEAGRRRSGRVVVVRVGDNATVGLEPLDADPDQLPAYEKETGGKGGFYSIDMDDIGGLREKEREDYH